jgi:hypothetical protein
MAFTSKDSWVRFHQVVGAEVKKIRVSGVRGKLLPFELFARLPGETIDYELSR